MEKKETKKTSKPSEKVKKDKAVKKTVSKTATTKAAKKDSKAVASKKTSSDNIKKSTIKKDVEVSSTSLEKNIDNAVKVEEISAVKQDSVTAVSKKPNEILRMILVFAVLIILVGLTFVVGLKNNDRARYQKHIGINEIDTAQYMKFIEDDDISIMYIARPTCGYCQQFEPILTSVLNKYRIGVEYIDISAIATQEEWDTFYNSSEFLSSGEWGTPTLIVYKNKEILDINQGYVDEATLVEFLTKNELIKG